MIKFFLSIFGVVTKFAIFFEFHTTQTTHHAEGVAKIFFFKQRSWCVGFFFRVTMHTINFRDSCNLVHHANQNCHDPISKRTALLAFNEAITHQDSTGPMGSQWGVSRATFVTGLRYHQNVLVSKLPASTVTRNVDCSLGEWERIIATVRKGTWCSKAMWTGLFFLL